MVYPFYTITILLIASKRNRFWVVLGGNENILKTYYIS